MGGSEKNLDFLRRKYCCDVIFQGFFLVWCCMSLDKFCCHFVCLFAWLEREISKKENEKAFFHEREIQKAMKHVKHVKSIL